MTKLTARQVSAMKEPGRYADGGGLYLDVRPSGGRNWLWRGTIAGQRTVVGLGPVSDMTLAQARDRAAEVRLMVKRGEDPRQSRARNEGHTFEQVARACHAALSGDWSPVQRHQWLRSLELYAFGAIGAKDINSVTRRDVVQLLEPIWQTKHETATRVLRRVGAVLVWAIAREIREDGVNVAEASAVRAGLPAVRVTVEHHAALGWPDAPDLMRWLDERGGSSAGALGWVLMTAARSGEARGLRRSELDLRAMTWTVPAERMKSGKEHVVPLSVAMVRWLDRHGAQGDLVWPGQRSGRELTDMGLLKVVRAYRSGLTVHGLRSTFRDWCGEHGHDRDLAEMALAHAVGGRVERAYARSTLLERRRSLMEAWTDWCGGGLDGGADVVPLRQSGG